MVDVTDSKSVGLIPRVGSSPTTGTTAPDSCRIRGCSFHVLASWLPVFSLVKNGFLLYYNEIQLKNDSIEKTIDTALQQAEAMRQSILKDAFEGRL